MKSEPNLIISAGMPRSGSTWLYNAIRLLLHDQYSDRPLTCGWCEDVDLEQIEEGMALIKIHSFDKQLVDRAFAIFYSYRDIRDALASYKRKFGGEPTLKMADHFVRTDGLWRKVSHYTMRYEDMIQDPEAVLRKIASVLGPGRRVNARKVLDDINGLDCDSAGDDTALYNKVNLLHKNHRTDGGTQTWKGYLDPGLLASIELQHRDWFIDNSYPL